MANICKIIFKKTCTNHFPSWSLTSYEMLLLAFPPISLKLLFVPITLPTLSPSPYNSA